MSAPSSLLPACSYFCVWPLASCFWLSSVLFSSGLLCSALLSQSHIATDVQSVSLGVEPHLSSLPDIYYCLTVTVLFLWGAGSDERTGRSFVYAALPCQRSHSRFRVPWDSRPYFTVSDLRRSSSSPPTTRRVTVEVFDPASTRVSALLCQIKSQSHIATGGQSVSKSWYRAPSGAHDQIFISVWQLRSCFRGAPSVTRGRVCLLYVPLALASAVFLGS
jgi:hypothetical protein